MSDFRPTPTDDAVECDRCDGLGVVLDPVGDEVVCPECDGLGEWFE